MSTQQEAKTFDIVIPKNQLSKINAELIDSSIPFTVDVKGFAAIDR